MVHPIESVNDRRRADNRDNVLAGLEAMFVPQARESFRTKGEYETYVNRRSAFLHQVTYAIEAAGLNRTGPHMSDCACYVSGAIRTMLRKG